MKQGKRYDISGLVEAQFEPGSRKTVLRNFLGVTEKQEMDRIETLTLEQVADLLLKKLDKRRRFIALDIKTIHMLWLGNIYPWAGNYRHVNVSKGNFTFAAAVHIPTLMQEFEENHLQQHTPCSFTSLDRVIKALAEVHTELVLIHPFREGNGRVARLFAMLMAEQSGLFKLNFRLVKGRLKNEYFAAVRAGMEKNYRPMEKIFSRLVVPKEA